MKKGNLITYHLLESSIGAYIEWLVNELMMTTNEIEYKDARVSNASADVITHKPNSLAYPWSLFFPPNGQVLRSTIEYSGFILPCCR